MITAYSFCLCLNKRYHLFKPGNDFLFKILWRDYRPALYAPVITHPEYIDIISDCRIKTVKKTQVPVNNLVHQIFCSLRFPINIRHKIIEPTKAPCKIKNTGGRPRPQGKVHVSCTDLYRI